MKKASILKKDIFMMIRHKGLGPQGASEDQGGVPLKAQKAWEGLR